MNSTNFRHTSKKYVKSQEEREYLKEKYLKQKIEDFESNRVRHPGALLLDSSLIIETLDETLYNVKVIECEDYIQLYYYNSMKSKKLKNKKDNDDNNNNDLKETILKNIKIKNMIKSNNNDDSLKFKEIELKNINRSKFMCQQIAKCNSKYWNTFITLTIADNIKDLDVANYKYKQFIYKIKRVFSDFMCLAVPEFQKRGAVHYHLLTNINIDDEKLIYKQEDNKKFYHIKYWNEGFTSVENVSGDMKKIIGYISKYMTKDIDDRLFGHHRYYITRNLKRPIINHLNLDNKRHLDYLNKIIDNKNMIYNCTYKDIYRDEDIIFYEYQKSI